MDIAPLAIILSEIPGRTVGRHLALRDADNRLAGKHGLQRSAVLRVGAQSHIVLRDAAIGLHRLRRGRRSGFR